MSTAATTVEGRPVDPADEPVGSVSAPSHLDADVDAAAAAVRGAAVDPDDELGSTRAPRSALVALGVYVVLRFVLPAKLSIGPLGQVGAPANIWGLLCLLWYASSLLWRGSGVHRGRQPMRWAFAMVLLAWLVSYALLPFRFPEMFERNGADAALIQVLSMVGVGLVAADGLENRRQIVALGRFICVVWSISAAVAVLQFLGTDLAEWITKLPGLQVVGGIGSVEPRGSFNRAAGTTTHPIEFATMTAMLLPLAIQLQPYATHRRRWSLLVLVIALGVPVSLSRSGFIGLAIGLLVIGLSWPAARRRKAILYGAALAFVMFAAVPGFLGTVTGMFTQASSDSSITTRTDDYAAVQPVIEARPVLGRGIGTFTPPRYRILDNQYLVTLIEAGAIGLTALIGFLTISAFTAHRAWNLSPPGPLGDLARAVLAAVLVAAAAMAFFDGFSFHAFAGTLFLLAGMGGAAWRVARTPQPAPV